MRRRAPQSASDYFADGCFTEFFQVQYLTKSGWIVGFPPGGIQSSCLGTPSQTFKFFRNLFKAHAHDQ